LKYEQETNCRIHGIPRKYPVASQTQGVEKQRQTRRSPGWCERLEAKEAEKIMSQDYLQPKDVLNILRIARESSTRDWCMFLLTFRHALRGKEAREMKVSAINMERQQIAITRAKKGRDGTQDLDRHKGEPLLDEIAALRAWFKEREEDGSQILFPSQKGGAMTRMQFLRLFKKYARAAGIGSNLDHPHALRHALCSTMASQHADIYAIQKRAGHKNISNTMIYTHVTDHAASKSCQSALMTAFS
jgi:site-specific recombinase XerD